jgi:hypothetical protein
MTSFYARAVFFVRDAGQSLELFVQRLGFNEDWKFLEEGRVYICQVSLLGFELILNQAHDDTLARAGHGRVFIGLDGDQIPALHEHIAAHNIQTERREWGQSTLVIKDLDGNEIFFWDWPKAAD